MGCSPVGAPANGNADSTCCQRRLTLSLNPSGNNQQNPLLGGVCLLTTGVLLCGRTCQALFMIFPTSCTHSLCGRLDGSVSPDLCWWLPDPWSSLAPNDLLSVVTALGHAPDPAGALGACEARGGPPLLIIGSRCEPVPPNAWSAPAQNGYPSPRDLGTRWDGLARYCHLEHSARWEFPCPQEAPQGDQ